MTSFPPPMSLDPPGLLSQSARAALRWAGIAAAARTGAKDPAPPDSIDLVAGIALAHLRDSPARVLLDHFEIPLGAVFSAAEPRVYPEAALLEVAAQPSAGSDVEPATGDVAEIVRHARARMPSSTDGFITLSMLFGAVLDTTWTAATAIRGLLAARAEDPDAVITTYLDHLREHRSLADLLDQRHPRRPLELPPFAADEPRRRRPGPEETPGESDLVGITAETDAFAYLVAARRLVPPLAVGLFGDWGSGKSYFLRSLQRRIDAITSAPTRLDPDPFLKSVAQIEFNAWQYVEGDLWASLLEHLFRNLRTSPGDGEGLLQRRHRFWVEQVDEAAAKQLRAKEERAALERKRQEATAEVGRRRAERTVKLAQLERRQRERPLSDFTPSPGLIALRNEALEEAGITGVAREAGGLATELSRTAELIREAGALSALIRQRGWKFFAALAFVLVAVPATAFLLSRVDLTGASAVAATVSWLIATAAGYLKFGNDALRGALDKVAAAQEMLAHEVEQEKLKLDGRIAEAERALATVTKKLSGAEQAEANLDEKVGELRRQLAMITPASVMTEFITERTGSDDYRRRLGIPAVVRRDLEQLSDLIVNQKVGAGEHAVQRIVLYIDDLDRCPTKLVIKVLEAVHLLLAFPLFVVVVAVDTRWLESSLRQHYPQLRARGAPAAYLEKIFQVPFRVRPLDDATRRRVVRGLLTPSLRSAAAAPAAAADGPLVTLVPDDDRAEFDRVVATFGTTDLPQRTWTGAADLSVGAAELQQLEDLADLLGATPRALKRFVNVYLLVKAMGLGQGWVLPERGEVALLLAMTTAVPDVVDRIVMSAGISCRLDALATENVQLQDWLSRHQDWRGVELGGLQRWVEPIRRFTFAT